MTCPASARDYDRWENRATALARRYLSCWTQRYKAAAQRTWSSSPKESLMKVTKNLGMLLLAIWLIATGLIPLLQLSFSGLGTVMAVLAVAAGGLILVGR